MTSEELAARIDQTLLKPDALQSDYENFLEMSSKYSFSSVCIPPHYVKLASKVLDAGPVKVSTVVGFPLGYSGAETKVFEAKKAYDDGAEEIDVVANISLIKSNNMFFVAEEIGRITSAVPYATVKVIVECCHLNDAEKVAACKAVINGGAHFVKTSTGFGPWGARVVDVKLLAKTSEGTIKVKAASGIKTVSDALAMIKAGADRIGTPSGVEIVEEFRKNFQNKSAER
ncbi:MAG: deoxyribose-phosphate aldolase [Deltaproteobacteria bacterium]|nr:deoxyribose-phosphate aldolase [Deltaproteobacteria bacterium]